MLKVERRAGLSAKYFFTRPYLIGQSATGRTVYTIVTMRALRHARAYHQKCRKVDGEASVAAVWECLTILEH